ASGLPTAGMMATGALRPTARPGSTPAAGRGWCAVARGPAHRCRRVRRGAHRPAWTAPTGASVSAWCGRSRLPVAGRYEGLRQNPFGNAQAQLGRRRGFGFSPRLLILVAFIAYSDYYYFSNRSTDPLTGETVLIDKSISPQDEKALGLQAYQEILAQETPVGPDTQISRQVREIAQRLIVKIPEVEDALAAEHGLQAVHIEDSFDWDVTVLQSDQANAFCLPGGKMAVYTGLVPVAQNADAMAIVMGHEITHALLRHGAQRMTEQKLAQLGQMAGAMSGMDQQQMQMAMAIYGYGR